MTDKEKIELLTETVRYAIFNLALPSHLKPTWRGKQSHTKSDIIRVLRDAIDKVRDDAG